MRTIKFLSINNLKISAASLHLLIALLTGIQGHPGIAVADDQSDLEKILTGTTRQPVAELEKQGLRLILNERMDGVNIEGWSTKPLTDAQADALFKKFGVRVVWDPSKGTADFITPSNVGRAGISEGEIFFKLNGKVYRGLTLKGYGGNNNGPGRGRGDQPEGSLRYDESIRDMEVSTILTENHVDTYLGVLVVERPNGKANYVRLSRTALRMEDFIRLKGNELKVLSNYMTDLLKDEFGKKATLAEFDEWLVKATADVMARKDYVRFSHASITQSNLGLGELVDLGDISDPSGLQLPGSYESQNAEFKAISRQVHENLAALDPSLGQMNFDQVYDSSYQERILSLNTVDRARFNLNSVTEAELVKLGFTPSEADAIFKYNLNICDGIIDPAEVANIKAITRDVKAILERATTDFMRLSDGSQLSSYYIRNVGGAEGVREILEATREYMRKNKLSIARDAQGALAGDVAAIEKEVERLALEQAKRLGFSRALEANVLTRLSKFISTQALEIIARR